MIRMIMMGIMRRFIAGPAITELRPFQDARFFEQPHRAVDGGDGNARIDDDGPRMQRLDIGMIGGLAQHPRDDATLFGHSQALLVAKGFDIDHMSHERNLGRSEEHTSELQSLMRNSYAVFCFKKKKK